MQSFTNASVSSPLEKVVYASALSQATCGSIFACGSDSFCGFIKTRYPTTSRVIIPKINNNFFIILIL
jgi:hypothetical protein